MKLLAVLELLRGEMPGHRAWTVAILTRAPVGDTRAGEITVRPIFDVAVDDDDAEINLLTDEESPDPRAPGDALTIERLLQRLEPLEARCAAYAVFSGSAWFSLDDDHEGRFDCPLVGVARNHEDELYGFLQHRGEPWETTS